MLSRVWTVWGATCVVATLLLSFPGALHVRADDQAPALSSEDPALVQQVGTAEGPAADGAPAGSACGQASAYSGQFAAEKLLAAEILRIGPAPAAGAPPAGDDDFILLNGSGYNYRPAAAPPPAGPPAETNR